MSNYNIDLKVTGEDLSYIDKIIRFISDNEEVNRIDINKALTIVEKEYLENEHYIIFYYMEFFYKVRDLTRFSLSSILPLLKTDKNEPLFVDSQHVNLIDIVSEAPENKGDVIYQFVEDKIKDIQEMEVSRDEFEEACEVAREIVLNLDAHNLIFSSSKILFDNLKVGWNKTLAGREDMVDYLVKGISHIRDKQNKDGDNIVEATKDFVYENLEEREELFEHPYATVQKAWKSVRAGHSISTIAAMNVGKTTNAINYISASVSAGVNTGLAISEMGSVGVLARIYTTVLAMKYNVPVPTDMAMRYLEIDTKIAQGHPITRSDNVFLQENAKQIRNLEHVITQIELPDGELGKIFIVKELKVEEIGLTMSTMRKEHDIKFLVVDHINGVTTDEKHDSGKINQAYIELNVQGKKHGVANLATNHIPDNDLEILRDPTKDNSEVAGFRGTESTKSPDYVLILDATEEQRNRGEMVMISQKDRNTGILFEPILLSHIREVGLLIEVDDLGEEYEDEEVVNY